MAARSGELKRAHDASRQEQWSEARRLLVAADRAEPLDGPDLELLATSLYMLGAESEYVSTMERAHAAHVAAAEPLAAVRCAFWIAVNQASKGKAGPAGGWIGRAERLLEEHSAGDCPERGYLLLPVVFEQEGQGDLEAAAATAAEAAAIGRRFGDADLFSLAAHEQGHILIRRGYGREGVRLLDEAMVSVAGGELSPVVTGIVYCGVILACQDAHEIQRAQEWTAALSDWCERQPDLIAFTGRCLVHRAELMQMDGSWRDALDEALRAVDRSELAENPAGAAEAHYRAGEILRGLGEYRQSESAYQRASHLGREPQPGLALLRLAQGRVEIAAASLDRALVEVSEPGRRTDLLEAAVEVALARDDLPAAKAACDELDVVAGRSLGPAPRGIAAASRGAMELAAGGAGSALTLLREAEKIWVNLNARHRTARVRELIGLACRAMGDADTAALELGAARSLYEELGAAPDLERVNALEPASKPGGLTRREHEVLRHIAEGKTNRAIAEELVLSERTVDRHVSNILAKLGVATRAAATARAFEKHIL